MYVQRKYLAVSMYGTGSRNSSHVTTIPFDHGKVDRNKTTKSRIATTYE